MLVHMPEGDMSSKVKRGNSELPRLTLASNMMKKGSCHREG